MSKMIDLFMFMGQSNMAGRGICDEKFKEKAPDLIEEAGYEFRAVSSPDRLYKITEPFGKAENRVGGIDDGDLKTGSMVTAFANAYYKNTGVQIVGVSASKGGSTIAQWQPGEAYLEDALLRLRSAVTFLKSKGYVIRHQYMLWSQGESDGDIAKSMDAYCAAFDRMFNKMMENGIEKCFMVRTGKYNGAKGYDYAEIRKAQDKIAQVNEDVIMVSTAFSKMKERGLMKDEFHYYQQAYNEVGKEAGENTALYVNTEKKLI